MVRLDAAAHVFVADLDAPELDDDDRHHLERVLRLRPGQAVTCSDGRGGWRVCEWATGAVLEPVEAAVIETRPEPVLRVGFVVPKGDRPEWIVQKLTEVGIDEILPLTSARSVVRWDGPKADRNLERMRRVAREAAMQSRRVWLPVVHPVEPVGHVGGDVAFAHPGGEHLTLSCPTVLVGPEGGWTPEEIAGQRVVGLGPTVLRAETAAIATSILLAGLRAGIVRTSS